MNDLPPELWTIIFKRLNLVDQIKCRLVNSRWKNIVDSIKVNDLMICDSHDCLVNSWFISNEPISLKNSLWNLKFSTSFQLPSRFYGSVRRLKLNIYNLDSSNLKWLHKFNQLEQLEINCINHLGNLLISLPCLNTLYIGLISENWSSKTEFLVFNTPKLQFAYFGYHVLNVVRLIHFDCLQYLELKGDGGYSDLNQFKNLKIVHCNQIMTISLNLMKSFIGLPKLVELHFDSLGVPRSIKLTKKLRILFNYFSEQIKKRRKLNLKLYFRGVLIKDDREFDDYKFGEDIWSIHMKHYDSLADCYPWYEEMYFRYLIGSTGEIPINFTQKYPNIRIVYVDKDVEQDKLIWFLRGCRNLVDLTIETSITQQFYDQLPDCNCGLRCLTVNHYSGEINFDFLYKLEFLVSFVSVSPLSMEIALDLMTKLKYCKWLKFGSERFREKQVYIEKAGKNDFKIEMRAKCT